MKVKRNAIIGLIILACMLITACGKAGGSYSGIGQDIPFEESSGTLEPPPPADESITVAVP